MMFYLLSIIVLVLPLGLSVLFISEDMSQIFIIWGFRLYLPFILLAILLVVLVWLEKKYFANNSRNSTYITGSFSLAVLFQYKYVVLLVVLLSLFLFTFLWFSSEVSFEKTEYFYEIGVSSIIDFPTYFIWSTPSMLCLYFAVSFYNRNKTLLFFFIIFVIALVLLNSDLLENNFAKLSLVNFLGIFNIFLIIIMLYVMYVKVKSYFVFQFILFLLVWIAVLVLGSESKLLTNFFIAKSLDMWNGLGIREQAMLPLSVFYLLVGVFVLLMKPKVVK